MVLGSGTRFRRASSSLLTRRRFHAAPRDTGGVRFVGDLKNSPPPPSDPLDDDELEVGLKFWPKIGSLLLSLSQKRSSSRRLLKLRGDDASSSTTGLIRMAGGTGRGTGLLLKVLASFFLAQVESIKWVKYRLYDPYLESQTWQVRTDVAAEGCLLRRRMHLCIVFGFFWPFCEIWREFFSEKTVHREGNVNKCAAEHRHWRLVRFYVVKRHIFVNFQTCAHFSMFSFK